MGPAGESTSNIKIFLCSIVFGVLILITLWPHSNYFWPYRMTFLSIQSLKSQIGVVECAKHSDPIIFYLLSQNNTHFKGKMK